MNALAKLGLVFLVVGAVALSGPVFGFTTIGADRVTTVETADGSSALVGIEPVDESIDGRQDTATVARIHNNFDSEMTLETTVDDGQDLRINDEFDSSVAAGDTTELVLECDGGGSSGTQTVTVTADEATANGIVVEEATTSVDVDYECTGGGGTGPASFEAEDVDADGPTQRFSFDVGDLNNKEARIDLSDAHENAGVDYTGASATIVNDQGGTVGFNENQKNITYDPPNGAETGTIEIELTGFEITGDEGGTAYYSDDTGRDDNDTFSVPPLVVSDGEDVETDGDVIVEEDGDAGDIDAGGDVTAGDSSTVKGYIDADGEIDLGAKSEVSQSITAGDDITVGSERQIKGDITSETGSVTMERKSKAEGSITAGDSVTVEEKVTVEEYIDADGNVVLEEDAESVDEYIDAGGDVTVRDGAQIKGEDDLGDDVVIRAGGDVTIESGATVEGEIEADGTIDDNS